MLYVFCDEDISHDSTDWRFVFSAVSFYQNKYNSAISTIQKLREGGGSLLKQILQALKTTEGFAFISQARVPATLLLPGADCRTPDIPRMACKDFVWSVSMLFTVATLVRLALERGWVFKAVDIFYDPKSLTREHQSAIEEVLHKRLKKYANQFVQRYDKNLGEKVNFRKAKALEKPRSGSQPDKFQLGIWLADRIVRRSDEVISKGAEGLIETENLTRMVNDTLTECLNSQGDSRDRHKLSSAP
jgi:hypothetical protein